MPTVVDALSDQINSVLQAMQATFRRMGPIGAEIYYLPQPRGRRLRRETVIMFTVIPPPEAGLVDIGVIFTHITGRWTSKLRVTCGALSPEHALTFAHLVQTSARAVFGALGVLASAEEPTDVHP